LDRTLAYSFAEIKEQCPARTGNNTIKVALSANGWELTRRKFDGVKQSRRWITDEYQSVNLDLL